MTDPDTRIREFAAGALSALTEAQRAECELLAELEPGMRLRPVEDDPAALELLWGGAVIGMTTWSWLNDGDDE